ncbi:hypothetical protein [Encephalitozoon cuniculi GB-M1]|uniref:Uncharacterized protein ECU01_0250 n=2 Tax=Encephalitozoon cuniculi TaxID=6035 RepID=Y125_ENCCU|nr:uncharacterized protein ECU01_0250 [Encephalitozoon cuniculi GB-M1]Q8SWQ4.1 RecName: Full=Uncharacterized protein ECU01_0250 [Encephalitozoon cuniculi GB-M1]AGE96094.1 hypothetical protein ECU01_0250 [Encephalitozoon cuniculi]CAD24895.1 hypothetical protein [Encephalitozoon cuniculi GB-M1]
MHFNIFVEGEFNNVKGVFIDQSYPLRIQCTNCGSPHEKSVVLSEDSVGEGDFGEKVNLSITCRCCRRIMTLKILKLKEGREVKKHLLPTNFEDEFKEVWLSDMQKSRFLVSRIETNGAEVTSIESCILNLVSNQDVLFTNVNFEDRTVAKCNNLNMISSIIDFSLTVELAK